MLKNQKWIHQKNQKQEEHNLGSLAKRNWNKQDYENFMVEIKDKPEYYHAIQLMYYCGLRVGEMMALTAKDFDFSQKVISINKAYYYLNGNGIIAGTKSAKCNRNVKMPSFVAEEMEKYLQYEKNQQENDRIFTFSKRSLQLVVDRGNVASGGTRILLHEIRNNAF